MTNYSGKFHKVLLKSFFEICSFPTLTFLFSCFKGGEYNLAERFTDFTKVLLLCIFYSAYYPLIYGLGAIILFVMYWTDKYLLLVSDLCHLIQ